MTIGAYTCLYCAAAGPWNQEHVLQSAFGTSWVLDADVCKPCNSRFSALDSKLIEFVRQFAYLGHPDVTPAIRLFGGKIGLTRDLSDGAWLNVRVGPKGRPIPFPQLIFLPSNVISFRTDTSRWSGTPQATAFGLQEYRQIITELSEVSRLSLKRSIVRRPEVQPAIVRSARYQYLLRGFTEEILNEIENLIRTRRLVESLTNGKSDEPTLGTQRDKVKVDITYELGLYARAIAKSAMNFVCAAVGRDLSRAADLDMLRAFINTGVGNFQRSVTFVFQQAAAEKTPLGFLAKPGCHTVLATGSSGTPCVFFFLYARLFAIVKLSDNPILAPDRQVAALFDYRAQTHQIFDTQRNAAGFVNAFFPAAMEKISGLDAD